MPASAISQLMGFIYNPDFKYSEQSALLKFRLGVSRYDFSSKKTVMDFFTLTAFGKSAQHIHSSISNGDNFICCFCDVKVSKYLTKSGTPVEHVEFIVHDFRTFAVQKSSQGQDISLPQDQPNTQSPHPQSDTGIDNPLPHFQNPCLPQQDPHNSFHSQQNTNNSLFPNSSASQQDPF
ncbi:MAG: hypothetical protein LBE98_04325 [Puniceicoccales bacterium]|nr:hypothetical protein [Puniceicoccales bacterium]